MAPARGRRRLPTLIDRGLGLLEVVLPAGQDDSLTSTLPDGQRDPGGFWYPLGYDQPGDIFTPQQRRLQAKQRQVQGRRLGSRARRDVAVSGAKGTAVANTTSSHPHAPPPERVRVNPVAGDAFGTEMPLIDRSMPLPSLSLEADPGSIPSAARASRAGTFSQARPPLPDDSGLRVQAVRGVVDSPKGSD